MTKLKGRMTSNQGQMTKDDQTREGLRLLHHPVLPLFRIVQFIYLTGPFDRVEQVIAQFTEPVETKTATYEDPAAILAPYLPIMKGIEPLKNTEGHAVPLIVDEQDKPVNRFSAMESWIGQQILEMELEKINSLLCGPNACVLCCVGPDYGLAGDAGRQMTQDFFEIPLAAEETALFELPKRESAETRGRTANMEPVLQVDGRPFYEQGPAIYHWRNGWTMILPARWACPQLDDQRRTCRIYPRRPAVCRRPQIFAYLIEKSAAQGRDNRPQEPDPVYVTRHKLLAVWDCPYVRGFKEEIAAYAAACGLEPVFMENKG
jgi:Fe-S-cluster containining protein